MLKVHLADGRTLGFDLQDEDEAREWMRQAGTSQFQEDITALALVQNGAQLSLRRPRGLTPVFLTAEHIEPNGRVKAADRLVCYAGDVAIVATAHASQRAMRIDVSRAGRMRYNPLLRAQR